jgi:O-antigen/teichoic acid export membrane protein
MLVQENIRTITLLNMVINKNLILSYLRSFKQNFSFFILAFSSLCFFLLNILLKDNLNADDYGLFSIFVTYISLLSSFGLLGFEQTLLRVSIIKSKLEINKKLILTSVCAILMVATCGSYLMLNNYDFNLAFFEIFIISILVVIIKLLFNLHRLISNFSISQLTLNFWKISLAVYLGFEMFRSNSITLDNIIYLIFSFLAISLFSLFGLKNMILLIDKESVLELIKKSLLFFITLFTLSLIGYGDRFFIESRFGLAAVGNYFFYINIFLFPFSLFQTYIGFKEIVTFKKKFDLSILKTKLILITKYSFVFSLLLFLCFWLVEYFGFYDLNIKKNIDIILALIFLGNIKIIYSLLSSVIGAVADNSMLYNLNFKSIGSILVLAPLIYYFSYSVFLTIIYVIILWIIRCIIWYNQIQKI